MFAFNSPPNHHERSCAQSASFQLIHYSRPTNHQSRKLEIPQHGVNQTGTVLFQWKSYGIKCKLEVFKNLLNSTWRSHSRSLSLSLCLCLSLSLSLSLSVSKQNSSQNQTTELGSLETFLWPIEPTWHTNFLNMFIAFLYMFRATMCPSSGENTVHMRHLVFVTLYR